jgi:hypothetical protein
MEKMSCASRIQRKKEAHLKKKRSGEKKQMSWPLIPVNCLASFFLQKKRETFTQSLHDMLQR